MVTLAQVKALGRTLNVAQCLLSSKVVLGSQMVIEAVDTPSL